MQVYNGHECEAELDQAMGRLHREHTLNEVST